MDAITLTLAKAYVNSTIAGAGALKGSPCTIKSTSEVATGIQVVFEWTKADNTTETSTIIIPKGTNGTTPVKGVDYFTTAEINEIKTAATVSDSHINSLIDTKVTSKQDTLVSGTSIKTINGQSILGSGDLTINSGASSSDLTSLTSRVATIESTLSSTLQAEQQEF